MTNTTQNPYVAYQLIIRGRVHGVGFRFFTRNLADKLAISGWVKNTPTGNVKIFVQGKQTIIDEFISLIKKGPPSALVRDVEIISKHPDPNFADFKIKF
jgi:acylphosphatase